MPPPTGVVSGPLNETCYSRQAATVSSGSQLLNWRFDFSPANTSIQWILRRPPYAFCTAASITRTLARQMSGPVPSPSMKGMMGFSGTTSLPSRRVSLAPWAGGVSFRGAAVDITVDSSRELMAGRGAGRAAADWKSYHRCCWGRANGHPWRRGPQPAHPCGGARRSDDTLSVVAENTGSPNARRGRVCETGPMYDATESGARQPVAKPSLLRQLLAVRPV